MYESTSIMIRYRYLLSQAARGTLDGIIDTVSAAHPLLPLLSLIKTHGKLVMVGAPEKPLEIPAFALIGGNISIIL